MRAHIIAHNAPGIPKYAGITKVIIPTVFWRPFWYGVPIIAKTSDIPPIRKKTNQTHFAAG
jgi:hypothetical protein